MSQLLRLGRRFSRRCFFSSRRISRYHPQRLVGGLILVLCPLLVSPGAQGCQTECTPRTAVITAYSEEIVPFIKAMKNKHEYRIQGVRFTVGTLNGEPIVTFMTGVSLTNAGMNTQRVLDQFNVRQIVFSGIGGSVDASQNIGDVVVPSRWATYGESLYARETAEGYQPSEKVRKSGLASYGMIYPRYTDVLSARSRGKEERLWFPVNDSLLSLARNLSGVTLESCASRSQCTYDRPILRIGGTGVSATIFMDNADYRDYLHETFGAQVADMETSAVAQVAYANQVSFIAFRGLSDLAGGEDNENEKHVYSSMAAKNAATAVCAFLKQLAASSLSARKA